MSPKPPKRTKQSAITSMGFPLLQKPAEMCVGRQIKVPGSYWKGCMSNEEANSLYLCTVREYHALHKWDAGGTPSQAMELQEVGVDGQVRFRSHIFYEVPDAFLTTLVRNFSPSTTGHHDHRYSVQMFLPHLLAPICTQTWQGKAARETLDPSFLTCPLARLLSSTTGLLCPMTSSLMTEILGSTQPHSSARLCVFIAT